MSKENTENKEQLKDNKAKVKKSSYSKNQNFHEIDGSMEIKDISQKIEEILRL